VAADALRAKNKVAAEETAKKKDPRMVEDDWLSYERETKEAINKRKREGGPPPPTPPLDTSRVDPDVTYKEVILATCWVYARARLTAPVVADPGELGQGGRDKLAP
jgi:hypothetical protein